MGKLAARGLCSRVIGEEKVPRDDPISNARKMNVAFLEIASIPAPHLCLVCTKIRYTNQCWPFVIASSPGARFNKTGESQVAGGRCLSQLSLLLAWAPQSSLFPPLFDLLRLQAAHVGNGTCSLNVPVF